MKNKHFFLALCVLSTISLSSIADEAENLLKVNGCLSCHHVQRKVVGPAFKDVARVYNVDKDAKNRFSQKMKSGSKGEWGYIPMPPQPTLTSTDIDVIFQWIVKQK